MFFKRFIIKLWEKRYLLSLLFLWSALVALSSIWNLHENYRDMFGTAEVEARTIFQHNLAYRRWNSMHGGVYAKVSEHNQPNPYIVSKNRDIVGTKGEQLTMINPFQMTKQAYDLLRNQSPTLAVFNRTVSLDPLNDDNIPDSWEEKALQAFDEGRGSISGVTTIAGQPYMRLISPYVTEERCLPCHEHQGYEVGDIRGGMSIAVPMQPYYDSARSAQKIIVTTHLFLWMLGAVTIVLFFTGLRRYQKTLEKKEENFRIVSEFAYNFEYWLNEKKELAFISPSCERITGYSRKEFMHDTHLMYNLIHPDDKDVCTQHLAEFHGPSHGDMEYRIITKDGDVRWVSHVCSPIYSEGKFLGRRGSNRDITEDKRLEKELQQAKRVEELGHFAGGVAHDFNNVLTSISTMTQLLQGCHDDEKMFKDITKNIFIAAKLGQNMTSNLLLFGRRRGKINASRQYLNSIVNDMTEIVRVLLNEGIGCQLSLAEDEEPVIVDQHLVEQILLNLVTNARDAMPSGGTLSIATKKRVLDHDAETSFTVIPAGSYMTLSVSDTGYGIALENLTAIFEPFYSTKSSGKGTGLGLYNVNSIVRQHGAILDIESVLEEGTTFRVFFPLPGDDSNGRISEVIPVAKKGEKGETVMLVDDEPLIRSSLCSFLEKKGYRTLRAADGEAALKLYEDNKEKIDLVILDVMLPGMNGREIYDIIKQQDPAAKILLISGSDEKELIEKNILVAEHDFLAKPLDMDLFTTKIAEMLARSTKSAA